MATQPGPEVPMPVEPEPEMPVPPGDPAAPQPEMGGRDGPDPVRYGDWEKGGVAVDF